MSEAADKSKGDLQPGQGAESSSVDAATVAGDDDVLAQMADDFGARLRRREHPRIEDYVARHPALDERIRKILSAVGAMENGRRSELASAPAGDDSGSTVGRYKLLERIGEGGFGVVYMAEQLAPVRRKVALKVIKPGMDSRQVLARFDAERQALAIMEHANIAKVFDGGMTDSGRPYFVMELVKGEPITAYCDHQQLAPRERLELFVQVCQAVQHAHQKGIIHRDIKPSNVLVSVHDTTPVVKVIDFGVAKALGQALTDNTLFTGFAQLLGTPLYMSPEQAGHSAIDVDTRSDIYSLGVLLYELLTGTTPFDKERFRKAAQDEIRRIICEEEPPRPSTRLSESKDSLPSISAQRHMEPARLTKLVRGELDWIVMKALEKDRRRRYETANGLARDIERYLHDEAVEACPPSAVYRLKKFARRNKGPVVTVALVLLTLVAGIVGTSFGLVRAEQSRRALAQRAEGERRAKLESEAREAETKAVLEFVEEKVFAAARPQGQDGGLGYDITLRKAIQAALPFVERSFSDRPLIEARLRMTLGQSFWYLGEFSVASAQFEAARALYTKHAGPDHPDTLSSMHRLAGTFDKLSRFDDAIKLFEETIALRKAKLGPEHPDTLTSMRSLAISYHHVGRDAEAVTLFEQLLPLQKAKLGPDHPETLTSMAYLPNVYVAVGRGNDALRLAEETVALEKVKLGPDHPDTLMSMAYLANIYNKVGRRADSLLVDKETIALQRVKLGEDHRDTLRAIDLYAGLLQADKKYNDLESLWRETLTLRQRALPAGHPATTIAMLRLANALIFQGKRAESDKIYESAYGMAKSLFGTSDRSAQEALHGLAFWLESQAKMSEAEAVVREALAIARKLPGDNNASVATSLTVLGRILNLENKWAEAEEATREALTNLRNMRSPSSVALASWLTQLRYALSAQKKWTEAEQVAREVLAIQRKSYPTTSPHIVNALLDLETILHEQEKWPQLEEVSREILTIDRKTQPTTSLDIAFSLHNLGSTLGKLNKPQEAEACLRESLQIRQSAPAVDKWEVANTQCVLGIVLAMQKKYEEAQTLLLGACNVLQDAPSEMQGHRLQAFGAMANFYEDRGDAAQAAKWRAKIATTAPTTTRAFAVSHPPRQPVKSPAEERIDQLTARNMEAWILRRDGDPGKSAQLRKTIVDEASQLMAADDLRLVKFRIGYGVVLTQLKQFEEAEKQLLAAEQGLKSNALLATDLASDMANLYKDWEKPQKAAEYLRKIPATQPAASQPLEH